MVTYDHQEESSSEETQINDHNDRSGVVIRRSYECFYCKRGFNTAQALGGHMNIHRKDRANKNKKLPSASNEPKGSKIFQENPNLPLKRTILPDSRSYNYQDCYLQLGLVNYGANYNTSSDEYSHGNLQLQHRKDHSKDSDYQYHHHRQPFDHSIEACDWMMRSSSEYYSPVIVEEDSEMNKRVIVDCDDDLDLELRLGYV